MVTTMGPSAEGTDTTPATTEMEADVAASTTLTEDLVTLHPSVETEAPAAATEEAKVDVTTAAETKNEVVIEEGTNEASGERRLSETNELSRCVLLME